MIISYCRLGFLWKYGGLYLDQDILVVNSLSKEKERIVDQRTKSKNSETSVQKTLGDNFIAFQSLNISHILPKDPTVGEVQDLYEEFSDQPVVQGNNKT